MGVVHSRTGGGAWQGMSFTCWIAHPRTVMDQVAEALRERGWPFTRPAACRLEGRLVIHGCSVRFALAVSARRGLVRYRFWRADDASGLVQLTYPLLSGTDAKL